VAAWFPIRLKRLLRAPYPGAKDDPVADELLDDADRLRTLLLETARLMPVPKVKRANASGKAKKTSCQRLRLTTLRRLGLSVEQSRVLVSR